MSIFLNRFKKFYQQNPIVLVDVGARWGISKHWEKANNYLKVIGFEPDEKEFNLLQEAHDKNRLYLNTALYKEKKELELFITRMPGSSSIFKIKESVRRKFPESERWDVIKTIKIMADTLDNQLAISKIDDVDFIKIDTQGSELFILEGASDTLNLKAVGVEVEVEFFQLYEDQPLFADVDVFLRNQGYELFDISRNYYKRKIGVYKGKNNGQIVWADALYFKSLDSFRSELDINGDIFFAKSKILKYISICLLYGYIGYALELISVTSSFFNHEEVRSINKYINLHTSMSAKIPDFKGRNKLAWLFQSLRNFMKPVYNGWATSDEMIGNIEK